jgi:hypothetical protein
MCWHLSHLYFLTSTHRPSSISSPHLILFPTTLESVGALPCSSRTLLALKNLQVSIFKVLPSQPQEYHTTHSLHILGRNDLRTFWRIDGLLIGEGRFKIPRVWKNCLVCDRVKIKVRSGLVVVFDFGNGKRQTPEISFICGEITMYSESIV